jgi:hypothetical protein
MYKTELKLICFSRTVLPRYRGFIIRGSFTERIYRELRGKPVLDPV